MSALLLISIWNVVLTKRTYKSRVQEGVLKKRGGGLHLRFDVLLRRGYIGIKIKPRIELSGTELFF